MVDRLLEVGRWLGHSGSCIYGTVSRNVETHFYHPDLILFPQRYFFLGAEYGSLRFTQTADTFCIISLSRPEGGFLEVDRLVPVAEGDNISLLGGGAAGFDLPFRYEGKKLVIDAPQAALDEVQHAWVFRVVYKTKQVS